MVSIAFSDLANNYYLLWMINCWFFILSIIILSRSKSLLQAYHKADSYRSTHIRTAVEFLCFKIKLMEILITSICPFVIDLHNSILLLIARLRDLYLRQDNYIIGVKVSFSFLSWGMPFCFSGGHAKAWRWVSQYNRTILVSRKKELTEPEVLLIPLFCLCDHDQWQI